MQNVESPALSRLAEIADGLGESGISKDIRQLISRINEGRFFVACVGQFKRGKSTLLNALVGEPVLPAGVAPVTTVPTVLRFGAQKSARVLIGGKWQAVRPDDLAQYVSEELNPENQRQVEGVDVFLPSPLLADGICLVDTPGIGSVFRGNTETTTAFLPQIDAAVLVVGADPPISGEELLLLQAVAAYVDQIFVVLNKIDRVSRADRQQAASFTRKVLEASLKKPVERIYEVSALNNLNKFPEDDDWKQFSGNLSDLATKSGQEIGYSAAERGLRRFSVLLQRSVGERERALKEPIAISEHRIATLRQTVVQANQWLRDLGAVFSAEQMRLSNTLLARRKQFLHQVVPIAIEGLRHDMRSLTVSFGPSLRREFMAIAQVVARQQVMPWLDAEEARAEELYGAVTQRFVTLVDGLLQRVSEEQFSDFAYLPKALDLDQGFQARSRFYFHDMITIARPASPLLYGIDALMGALRVRRWFQNDAERFLEQLLNTNASRVQGDVEQRVVESRLRLESEVRKLLHDVSTTAEQALAGARETKAAGTNAVSDELQRFGKLREELKIIAGNSPSRPCSANPGRCEAKPL